MDMFNKLKSAVSSALPGNPMSKDFDVYDQIATAGPGLLWKVYNGTKKTTKQDAAIFVFEKKSIERYSKRDKEIIIDTLKRGASQLTRLRHPKILSVIQPLEESRESLAFATEPVFATLANLLGNHDNIPENVAKQLKEYSLYDLEIKYGLLQVTEGIQFLHNDVKLLHNNLWPGSIVVNKSGSWKLSGFDFCVPNKNPSEQAPLFPYKRWETDVPPCVQQHLDYLAPEYVISESCSLASDMFTIGVLMYTVFNQGKPLYECKEQYSSFRKNAEELRKWRGQLLGKIPSGLQEIVKLLLNTEPTVRPDPDQLSKINFFEDVGCVTLQYMDSLFQQENLQKSKFFKGLPKIIAKFPKRVNQQRILPALMKECVNHDMIPFVLPNILQIAEQSTDKEYVTIILPELIPMFKITAPVQILLIFMQNMSLLLKKTPGPEIKSHVLPMIHRGLESNNSQIQELCLNIIPTFADLIDYTSLKNSIVPRIKHLCLSTTVVTVRVNCLLCIGKLLEAMDRWFVLDEVLPMLPHVPSREPAVLMSILGIYKVALTHQKLGITKEILASKVVPFLVTISIEHTLNLSQFSAYMKLIREMLDKVETEHHSKLEQLEQMKQEQKNLEITKITETDDKTLISGIDDKPKTMMDSFLSGVGMGDGGRSSNRSSSMSPKPTAATSQPAKVSLSLEEKQRIAKQQEQQRFHQIAKPVDVKTSNNPMKPKSSNEPKDLTSSLMQANMMGLSSSAVSKPSYSINSSPGQGVNSHAQSNTTSSVFGGMNSGVNYNVGMPMSQGQTSNVMFPTGGQSSSVGQTNKSVDLSSFDSLMSTNSQKSKPPMNMMAGNSGHNSMQLGTMGNMNNRGMMGNSGGMMGNSGGMMGQQSMMNSGPAFGSHSGFAGQPMNASAMGNIGFQTNQGVMGNSGFQSGGMTSQGNMLMSQPMTGQNLMQPTPTNNMNNQLTSKNDLDDLFG